MNKENKQELYASPTAEVIEVGARQVMCLSNNGLGSWSYDDNDL